MGRGRPKIYSNLVTTNVKLPLDMLETAKSMGINISETTREAIAHAIGDERRIEVYEKKKLAESQFKGVPKQVINNLIETSRKWKKHFPKILDRVNKEYGTNIKPEDIYNFQETY